MRAARIYGFKDVRIEEIPVPEIEPNEVLVQVKTCGVCHVDFEYYGGIRPIQKAPVNIGHEVAGVATAIGQKVKSVAEGDRVVVDLLMRCGKCYYCRKGKGNLCTDKGPFPGAFSDYTKAPEQNVFKIPSHVSFEEASLTEPLGCCINGLENAKIMKGDDVVVIGAGPMGLMSIQLAKLSGARVIASDLLDERLKLAMEFGADELVNPSKEDPVEKVKQLTEGRGVQCAMVAIGNLKAMEQGIKMAGRLGTVVLFGAIWPSASLTIDPNIIHYNEIAIVGAEARTLDQFYRALKMIADGIVKVKPLVTHEFPLSRINEALEAASSKAGLKIMITMDEGKEPNPRSQVSPQRSL
jgi:L-iditol 2-dehydrogenase